MRSLRLTIFLWIILVLAILLVLPTVLVVLRGIFRGNLDLTDFSTSLVILLTLAPAAFQIFLIIKMFHMEAWARRIYLYLTAWSSIMGLIAGNVLTVFISIAIHVFVFWRTWDEFY